MAKDGKKHSFEHYRIYVSTREKNKEGKWLIWQYWRQQWLLIPIDFSEAFIHLSIKHIFIDILLWVSYYPTMS